MFTNLAKRKLQEIPGVIITEGRCAIGTDPSKLPMLMVGYEIKAIGDLEIHSFVNKTLLEIQQCAKEKKEKEATKRAAMMQNASKWFSVSRT